MRITSKTSKTIQTIIIILFIIEGFLFSTQDPETDNRLLKDPFLVMTSYYAAIGGLNQLKAEKTQYFEAVYYSAGIKGSIKQWHHLPNQWRREVNMLGFINTSGCNGTTGWEVDRNGKIKIQKSLEDINDINVTTALYAYEHMNPETGKFSLQLQGTDQVDNVECYVVNITNTLNRDIYRYYINTSSFLLEKSVAYKNDGDLYARYKEYRLFKGILRPLRMEMMLLPHGAKYALQVTRLTINEPIDPTLFNPPQQDVKDFHFLQGDRIENIPFQYREEQIFLPVIINGKKQEWLLDSGSNATVIDRSYARELGLLPKGQFKGRGAHYSFYYSYIRGPEIELPGLKIDKQFIIALDLPMNYHGILGYDFLSRFVTRIDYDRQRISFYNPNTFNYTGDGKTLKASLLGKDLIIEADVEGKYPGNWRVDLGATFTAFHFPYASTHHLLSRKGKNTFSHGIGGSTRLRSVQFNHMQIAGYRIPHPAIAVPIQPTGGAFLQKTLAGNIGNSILCHFILFLNYQEQMIILETGKKLLQTQSQ